MEHLLRGLWRINMDAFIICPNCKKVAEPYAEIDPEGKCTGEAEITAEDGEARVDLSTLYLDCDFLYKCDNCGHVITKDLDVITSMIKAFEKDE